MKKITLPSVKGLGPRKLNLSKKLFIYVAIFVLLGLVAGSFYYWWSARPEGVKLDPNESISGQIDAMTSQEIDSLAHAKVNASKDFTRAHAKALALTQKGDYAASATTYKALIDTDRADHELYVEYAAALYYSGDKQGGIRAMETAIEKVKASNTSQADKDSIVRMYNNYLSGYRDGASQ